MLETPFHRGTIAEGAHGTFPVCLGAGTEDTELGSGKAALPGCWHGSGTALAPEPAGGSHWQCGLGWCHCLTPSSN